MMVNAMDTVNAVDTLRNKNGLPNELNAPFTDPDLQALWTTAIKRDKSFEKIQTAVAERARKFPKELKLQVSIAECDINNLGRLRYRERTWIPAYEPLRTELMQ